MDRSEVLHLLKDGRFESKLLNGKLIETHISWVVLTKDYAFKIKKPIKYNFLDFSNLQKRKFYCNREVELNSRLSNIYLDVQPVVVNKNNISIGEYKGKILDYAVRMRRMNTHNEMDKMLIKNKVTTRHIRAVARETAAFHLRTEVTKTPFNRRTFMDTFNDIQSVSTFIRETLGKTYAKHVGDSIVWSNSFLKKYEEMITQRIQKGFQRDCHGDLHSKNIFLYDKPIIFDCIEFNDSFRQIDVLNEIAFFCMDLDAYNRPDLEKVFLDEYLSMFPCCNGDEEVTLFNYYKCYRANIRAKVNALRALQAPSKSAKELLITEIKKYLNLMTNYRQIR